MSAGFVRRIEAQAAGQTTHRNAKGVCTVPDYKAMYFELFRASVQAVQLLQDAQTRAEQPQTCRRCGWTKQNRTILSPF